MRTFDENNEVITETSGGQLQSHLSARATSGADLQCHVISPECGDWWMTVRLHATDPTPAMGWTF